MNRQQLIEERRSFVAKHATGDKTAQQIANAGTHLELTRSMVLGYVFRSKGLLKVTQMRGPARKPRPLQPRQQPKPKVTTTITMPEPIEADTGGGRRANNAEQIAARMHYKKNPAKIEIDTGLDPLPDAPSGVVAAFLTSSSRECKWIYGADETFQFCTRKTQAGSSYCPHHHAVCWVKPETNRRQRRATKKNYNARKPASFATIGNR